MPRRSGRVVSQPNRYLGLIETQVFISDDGVEDPLSYKQTMNDVDKDQWGVNGSIREREIQLGRYRPLKLDLLQKDIFYYYEIWQMDVKTAFVNDNLKESIFMSSPEGFIPQGQEQKVCKLNRSIYGLKQASRSWNIRFDTTIKSYGFDQNVDGPCVYKKINKGKVAFFALYVDDILLIGNENSKKDLLPFRHGVHLSKEQCPMTPQEVEDIRRISYASAVGSLMYVMLWTRLDICYAVE
ncbi:gag/pol protein [Cucumis melo var. makuwa]|uniref:Gag/pol protein n=1 Tax=Cucumis melo var. makuwa TaxID=1194695 RepID=A0A5D3DIE8_CUCMM|nr:gag/pol protein [Cucumis melo var. makuwa]TYK23414.1 gag/pol protein [Cucumis melo var. makuwa]